VEQPDVNNNDELVSDDEIDYAIVAEVINELLEQVVLIQTE
jgi:hypothetical protein